MGFFETHIIYGMGLFFSHLLQSVVRKIVVKNLKIILDK